VDLQEGVPPAHKLPWRDSKSHSRCVAARLGGGRGQDVIGELSRRWAPTGNRDDSHGK
jgi:hypothetical protein